jgi:uncharacterized membrane protein YdbT with pleckstrin-like domain
LDNLTEQLRSNEKVLWQGKPKLFPFIFAHNAIPFIFGLFFMAVTFFFFLSPMLSMGFFLELILFPLIFFLIGFLIAFGQPIWSYLAFRNTEYMISDQRLITQTGAVGLDTRFVDLEKVQEVSVQVGVFDRLFGTGSIYAMTAGQAYVGFQRGPGWGGSGIVRPSLSSLEKPYEVQRLLQEAIQDLKKSKT